MKRDFVEETKSRYRNEDGTCSELPFVCQVDLVGANLIWSQFFRRFTEMACEQRDLLHVGVLGMRREVPHLHVLGHASSKGCHGKPLCAGRFCCKELFRALATLSMLRYRIPRSGLVQDALCGLPSYVALSSRVVRLVRVS